MMLQVDGYFTSEKLLQSSLTDLGLQRATTILEIDQPYVPPVAAVPAFNSISGQMPTSLVLGTRKSSTILTLLAPVPATSSA